MRRLKILDVIMSVLIVVLVACVLVPAVGRVQRPVADATCQRNMRMLGRAIDLYTADNNRRYPTNRPIAAGYVRPISDTVRLSDPKIDPETGLPVRFQYGIAWVEGLYPYIRDAAKGTGRSGWPGDYLVCPNASSKVFPPGPYYGAAVTYVFNRNLIEYFPPLIRNPRKLMMLREIDRLVPSMLRPMNDSTGSDAYPPLSPFLTDIDSKIYSVTRDYTDPNMHGNGSYILFADGHVKYFDVVFYPEPHEFSKKAQHWDPLTAQWYNWYFPEPANPTEQKLNRSIAITP